MAYVENQLAQCIERSVQLDENSALEACRMFEGLREGTDSPADLAPKDLQSVDAILDLTRTVLPGWSVHITGEAREPDGRWHCTVRKSASRDDDEFVGIGMGPKLSYALLAALVRIGSFQASRRSKG